MLFNVVLASLLHSLMARGGGGIRRPSTTATAANKKRETTRQFPASTSHEKNSAIGYAPLTRCLRVLWASKQPRVGKGERETDQCREC